MQAGQNLYLTTDYTDYAEIFAFEKRYALGRTGSQFKPQNQKNQNCGVEGSQNRWVL